MSNRCWNSVSLCKRITTQQQQKTTITLLIFYYNYFSFCCNSPAPPSNCNGVEYDQVPEVEELEHTNQAGDPDTPQPSGVVCPPGEDEPAGQEEPHSVFGADPS
jgi:hypothetical protein